MQNNHSTNRDPAYGVLNTAGNESWRSGVNWAAVLGGAFAAMAASTVLITLGSGLGFASLSPWDSYSSRFSMTEFTVTVAIWLLVTQWLASALGGYLAGRLRTKWVGIHTDEVFFRDTANGFLSWAVATILMAAIAAGIAGTAAGTTADADRGTYQAGEADPTDYYVDSLYRTTGVTASAADDGVLRAETRRIFIRNAGRDIPDRDRDYLARRVVARTGLSLDDATARVNDVIVQHKTNEDDASKAASRFALFTCLAMLVGAFIASAAAALGGLHRDDLEVVHLNG